MQLPLSAMQIETLPASSMHEVRDELVHLLRTCVHGGASLGFLAPLPEAEALDFWISLVPQMESGNRRVLVARDGPAGPIVGCAQLLFETKPNGRHRAEVCKVMVLPSHRRKGIAAALMNDLERHARNRAIRLLVLDTSEGLGGAKALYESLGYTYVGGIPGYALDPDGRPEKNAIYYKQLG